MFRNKQANFPAFVLFHVLFTWGIATNTSHTLFYFFSLESNVKIFFIFEKFDSIREDVSSWCVHNITVLLYLKKMLMWEEWLRTLGYVRNQLACFLRSVSNLTAI